MDIIANAFKVVIVDKYNIKRSTGDYPIEYSLNTKTVPEFGKLFVFRRRDHALEFAKYISPNARIFPCYAENLKEFYSLIPVYKHDFKRFWERENFLTIKNAPPTGTCIADSVTLLIQD